MLSTATAWECKENHGSESNGIEQPCIDPNSKGIAYTRAAMALHSPAMARHRQAMNRGGMALCGMEKLSKGMAHLRQAKQWQSEAWKG